MGPNVRRTMIPDFFKFSSKRWPVRQILFKKPLFSWSNTTASQCQAATTIDSNYFTRHITGVRQIKHTMGNFLRFAYPLHRNGVDDAFLLLRVKCLVAICFWLYIDAGSDGSDAYLRCHIQRKRLYHHSMRRLCHIVDGILFKRFIMRMDIE